MAELDPRLTALVDTLLRSPLAALINAGLNRLEEAERAPLLLDGDHDPFAPRSGESSSQRALRQLDLLDQVVRGRILLELKLWERSQGLAREIRFPDPEGAGAIGAVQVINSPAGDVASRAGEPENLLGERRRAQLGRLLKAWDEAVVATRAVLETGSEG